MLSTAAQPGSPAGRSTAIRYLPRRIIMQRALLTLALIAGASAAYAQTMPSK